MATLKSWGIPKVTPWTSPVTDLIREIRESWGWTGIDPVEIVSENEFGNLIIRDTADRFWRLCPEDVYCEVIANDVHTLDALMQEPDFLEDWSMTALVESARRKLGDLTSGRKYHFVIPGLLGGAYDSSNFKIVPLVEIIRFSGDVGYQVRDLPDGAQVQLKVIE